MTAIKWLDDLGGNPVSLITTDLNSLTTTGAALSAAIDNTSGLDLYMDLELLITYGTNPTANSIISAWVARSVDGGSNYEDASATGPIKPRSGAVGAFSLRAVTTAQRMIIPQVIVPPGFFKVLVCAETTGQTAAASGNVLRARFYKEQAA